MHAIGDAVWRLWSRQLSEHALFLNLGIVDVKLKDEANVFRERWETFRNRREGDARTIAKDMLVYQKDILSIMNTGKWIGWLWPTFIEHITMEMEYFLTRISLQPPTCDEEIAFWNHVNSEHAIMAAQLLDHTEEQLHATAMNLSKEIGELTSEANMYAMISLKYGKQIKPRAIIHPVLLDHIIREGKRGNAIMTNCVHAMRETIHTYLFPSYL